MGVRRLPLVPEMNAAAPKPKPSPLKADDPAMRNASSKTDCVSSLDARSTKIQPLSVRDSRLSDDEAAALWKWCDL
jgi:hypothetical protein